MTQLEKLSQIDLAIKTVQQYIRDTPEEDHYGDLEYLDSLRGLQLEVLLGVCAENEDTKGEDSLNESISKQTMKELYEVLTEAHDKAMYETLTGIYDNNYIVPKRYLKMKS